MAEKRRISDEQGTEDPLSDPEKKGLQVGVQHLSPNINAQWKATFYENIQPRALNFQERKIQKLQKKKMQEIKTEKKEPPDSLSRDWFNAEAMTLDTRAYLLDKLLPTLVPGVEKLLRVAEKKNALEEVDEDPSIKFDPINFLGEYLMRHNPAYDISAIPNPYMRGMMAVKDELKSQVPETTMHKLAEMKNLVKEKRQHREEVEEIKARVTKMRKEALAVQFKEWTQDAGGSMPLALVQSALTSFLEVVTSAPPDAGAEIYARPLEAIGTLEVKVNEEGFAEYVHSYIKNFTSDMFQELLKHFLQCSNDTRDAIRHDIWRQMFVQLFLYCDYGKVGLLDRPRILSLLESFYDDFSEFAQGFRDPRKWPVIELDDIDLSEFWGNMEDDEPTDRSVYLPSPVLELSEEALALSVILKGILSDPEQAALLEASDNLPELEATSEEGAVLEQKVSTTEEGTETDTLPATASREQVEIPASELEPNGPEVQKDQDPTDQIEAVAAEEAASEEPVPEAIDAELPEQNLEVKEADGKEDPESPPVDLAAILEQALEEKEEGPVKPSGSEEGDLAAKASEAEPASSPGEETAKKETDADETVTREEAGEKADPDSQEPPDTSTEDQVPDQQSSPSQKTSGTSQNAPQLVYGEPWSGDLKTIDLALKYIDYGKEIRDDWNNENSRFPDLRQNMIELQILGPPSCTNAFNKSSLNLPQFVQLMETFVGEEPTLADLKMLVEFVKERYVQLEREKILQLETVHHKAFLVRRQLLLAALFEKWDNECSGYLDMEEVDTVLRTFKEGMEDEALNKAKMQLPVPQWHPSGVVKLTPKDFQTYIELVVSELTGNEDEVLDNIVEFLMTTVERSHMDRLRGSARRKWLRGIQHIAKSNGRSMEPVYQAVFRTLCKDSDAHGYGKRLSAYIALLEYNPLYPERGEIVLHYVACTEDDAPYVLNKILYMDMKGISFAAVLDNKPIHVPRVHLHGNIHFWDESRLEEERKGSFLVIPLEDVRRRVFGILGLDTLRDHNKKTIFVPQEIRFYQGVANTFSIAYHYIRTQENIMQVITTAVRWLSTRTPSLYSITTYFMEPGEERMRDYTLRKVMTSEWKGHREIHLPLDLVISRKENVFRNYLFKCIDCAEVVTACVYEEYHIAVPLRDTEGQAIAAFDLNLGPRQRLPSCEHKDLQKALKMLQSATCEILKEDAGDLEPYYVLEAEYVGDWRRGGVLFYRFMLQDLQNCIWNLDPLQSFGEIRSFDKPVRLVHKILKSVLLILYPQWAGTDEVDNWNCCLEKIDGDLIENICYFDPTAAYVQVQPESIYSCLRGAERRDVWRFGSAPIEYLYNWTVTCLSLIELAKKLQREQSMSTRSVVVHQPIVPQSSGTSIISAEVTTQSISFA